MYEEGIKESTMTKNKLAHRVINNLLNRLGDTWFDGCCSRCHDAIAEYKELTDEEVTFHHKVIALTPDINVSNCLTHWHINIVEGKNLKR